MKQKIYTKFMPRYTYNIYKYFGWWFCWLILMKSGKLKQANENAKNYRINENVIRI